MSLAGPLSTGKVDRAQATPSSCHHTQRKDGIVNHTVMPASDLFLLFGSSVSEDHDQPQGVNGHRSDRQAASA